MAARSEEKAAVAIQELKRETGKDDIHWLKLELDDLSIIKATVDAFLA
jgi:retinol dehydrogenase-12